MHSSVMLTALAFNMAVYGSGNFSLPRYDKYRCLPTFLDCTNFQDFLRGTVNFFQISGRSSGNAPAHCDAEAQIH